MLKLQDVQSDRNRIAESGAVMRMNSILPELASKLAEELAGGGGGGGFGGESGMGGAGTAYTDGTGAARFDASTQKGRTGMCRMVVVLLLQIMMMMRRRKWRMRMMMMMIK